MKRLKQPAEWIVEKAHKKQDGSGRIVAELSIAVYGPDDPVPDPGDVLIVKPKEEA